MAVGIQSASVSSSTICMVKQTLTSNLLMFPLAIKMLILYIYQDIETEGDIKSQVWELQRTYRMLAPFPAAAVMVEVIRFLMSK